uniref:Cellular communication network factor 5 n=1 Tax=Nomascus leucogenys TaxID=61853 RepID=A0A2I3HCR6_NOMLE
MRGTPKTHLLAFSLLCLLSKVCTQLCPTPCTCPWPPTRCPLGVPLVLDGCGCCRVCARRLGEPCDQLHVCDASQGLVCQPGAGPGGRGALCLCKQDPSFLALSLPCPLVSPAQNGARPGDPARPPVGWAWPPGCPTRTASADWRPSAACACPGPVHPPGVAVHKTVPSRPQLGMGTWCPPSPAGGPVPGPWADGRWSVPRPLAAGNTLAWVHHAGHKY